VISISRSIFFRSAGWPLAFAALLGLAAVAAPVPAQLIAVPYYGPDAFVAALQARAQAPQAARFDASAQALVEAIESLCAAPGETMPTSRQAAAVQPGEARLQARDAWLAAADAWERLQAVSVGATLARRSARSLDFRPARPALIKRAVGAHGKAKEPPDAKALERVGAPAKGLPALEWLLWDRTAPQTPAACRYASGLAQAVHREATALATAHAADAARNWPEEAEAAADRAAEAVNQWLAGLEILRWRYLGKPLAIVSSKGGPSPDANRDIWPRPPSASHREAWQARWESLRNVAIGPAPTDGFGPQPAVAPGVISLEALLRGRGRNDEADGWARLIMTADQAMQALTEADGSTPAVTQDAARGREQPAQPPAQGAPPPGTLPSAAEAAQPSGQEIAPLPPRAALLPPRAVMDEAVNALDAVRQFMQDTMAPALKVNLGFSDADGD
jgi:predicted lipoprotein